MGRKQAAQIAALEADNARLIRERDKAQREAAVLRAFPQKPAPSLVDTARAEVRRRWERLCDVVGI